LLAKMVGPMTASPMAIPTASLRRASLMAMRQFLSVPHVLGAIAILRSLADRHAAIEKGDEESLAAPATSDQAGTVIARRLQ
jgi:hypothetical protein